MAPDLIELLNPQPSALGTIAWGTLVRFVAMMLVVFGFMVTVFIWDRATASTCVEIWQFRGESEYWLDSCIQQRGRG